MRRFAFRLQPLLNFKNYKERLARQEMAKAQLDVKDCERMIESLKQSLIQSEEQMDRLSLEGMSAVRFQQFRNYLRGVTDTIAMETHRKAELEKVVEDKRVILKRKTVEKKTMEKLREKQAQAYSQEVLMSEQKDLDEICALKTAREITHDAV